MKRTYTRESVVQIITNVLEFEVGTRDLYEEYLDRLSDAKVRNVFRLLMDEEVQHVESIQAILELIR